MIINRRTSYVLKKVLTSPKNLLNALMVIISYILRLRVAYGRPIVVDLEPSNACNFRCPHCELTYAVGERKTLSLKQYNVIMSNFPYALRVKLQGAGEPFLNESLYDFIENTCFGGAWCEVITNGSILDLERLKKLERFNNFQMIISFDAADKATFEKIRVGSNFEKILENIELATNNSTIDVAAWMLLQDDNADQVKAVLSLLSKKKVGSLGVQKLFFDYDKETLKGKWIKKELTENSCASLKSYAKQRGVKLTISDKLYNRRYICPWPWMGVFVDTLGNVIPCCRIGDDTICNMGNLNENNIDKIWNSKEYKDFRIRHKINDIPDFCSGCYSDSPC